MSEREQQLVASLAEGKRLSEVRNQFPDIDQYRVFAVVGEAGFAWTDGVLEKMASDSTSAAVRESRRIAPLENVMVAPDGEQWWRGVGLYTDYMFSSHGRAARYAGKRGVGARQPLSVQPTAKPVRDKDKKIVAVEWVLMVNLTLPNGEKVKRNLGRLLASAMKGQQPRKGANWFE